MAERIPSMDRRGFLRFARNAGAAAAVFTIDNSIPGRMLSAGATEPRPELKTPEQEIDHIFEYAAQEADHSAEARPEPGGHAKPVDYMGAALFGKGLYELSPKGRGHVGMTEYAALGGLLGAKYLMGDDERKSHITAEIKSSLVAR